MVRNLPEVKPGIPLLGINGTDTPLQGIPTVGERLGHLVSGAGGLLLAKKALSTCTRRKLKKGKSKGKRSRNWGHSATRKCRHAQAGRNLD
jgi:hypothetical protein